MSSWLNHIDEIYVINLDSRTDRLLRITDHFDDYEIPFKRVEAVKHEKGAEGLRLTMVDIFTQAINENYDNILVFEDDAKIIVTKEEFSMVMDKVVKQLPDSYIMCFLGCQPTRGFQSWHSANLLPVQGAFSTHAVMYSRKGMELILASNFSAPIDNHFVSHIQEPYGNCYAIDPFLCTQEAGVSDIGGTFIDWGPFLETRHIQKVNELRGR